MKYIFTAESNALVVTVNEESGKFKTEKKTFKAPSFELANESIHLKDYGTFEKEYKFAEIQTIDGVAPTDILDALNQLNFLTANFNGGGTAPTLQAVTDSSAVTTNPIDTSNVILRDILSGNYGTFDTSNLSDIRTYVLPDTNGTIGLATESLRSTASTGTISIANGKKDLVYIHEAGISTISLTIQLPSLPIDNQKVTIMSVSGIVDLTITTAVGTIIGAVTTLSALATTELIWIASQSKWYKIR